MREPLITRRERSPAALLATETTAEFDDIGALVAAMRYMLEDRQSIDIGDLRTLFVLASMAETAWMRLDKAMSEAAK